MESKTALVGTKSAVVLNTETTVDLEVALIVVPGYAELDDTLGDSSDGESGAVLGVLREELAVLETASELCIYC